MAYRIIKWVKGRPYLYEQSSFRVGGKVRTESRYMGAASNADVAAVRTRQETRRAVAELTGGGNDKPADQTTPSPPEADPLPATQTQPICRRAVITTMENARPLTIKADLSALRIAEKPLQTWYGTAQASLARQGINLSAMPPVTVRHGLYAGFHKAWFGRGYVVTLPRGKKGNRTTVRTAFSKAVAAAALDAVQAQQPDLFSQLSLQFNETHRATTLAVIQYVANTRDRWKWAIVMTAWTWNRVPPIFANKKRTRSDLIEPSSVGLYEWGDRKDWRADAEAALATVLRDGYKTVCKQQRKELFKARAAERSALDGLKKAGLLDRVAAVLGRSNGRKALRRALARISALNEQGRALKTLHNVFKFTT